MLTINRGTTFTLEYEHQVNGSPAPLTGATVFFTVKEDKFDDSSDDSTAIIKKDVSSHTDAAAGLTTITLNPADTEGKEPGKYWFDIIVENSDGSRYRMIKDRCELSAGPTNR